MDVTAIRRQFPVTERMVFLNNAAESPLSLPVRRRLNEYLDQAAWSPDTRPPARHPLRPLLARLLGGSPDEYALVTSTGVGIGLAAAGYPWASGDNIVVPAGEHWNNTFPWLALRARGVDVRVVPLDGDRRLDPGRLAERVDGQTRVVAVSAVNHLTGFRSDLRRLSRIAHDRGALLVVDGVQAAGVVPLNVDDDGIDVLAGAGFKWLLGLHGTGYVYVRKNAWDRIQPVFPGMFAAEDDLHELRWLPSAQRYETGSLSYALFHAWTAGLEMILEIGVPAIHARVLDLTSRLIDGLRERGMTVTTPAERADERSAIVTFTAAPQEANRALHARLSGEGIGTSLRGGQCRVSPSFYNTEDEIDRLLAALA
jgi:selenocysteine lyase/cysteine desulfurase